MDEIKAYKEGIIKNLKCYFDENLNYVEEFDTDDEEHHVWVVKPEDWNEKIIKTAIEIGIIEE